MSHQSYSVQADAVNTKELAILNINPSFERHYVSIVFFSDSDYQSPVDMSSLVGVIKFSASDNGFQFGTIQVGDNLDGVLTLDGQPNYDRPNIQGSIVSLEVDISGVTNLGGATHYQLFLNSHG